MHAFGSVSSRRDEDGLMGARRSHSVAYSLRTENHWPWTFCFHSLRPSVSDSVDGDQVIGGDSASLCGV